MHPSAKYKFLAVCLAFLVFWSFAAGNAGAAWVLVGGNNGNLQNPMKGAIHRIVGLQFSLYDETNWVHFAIPTPTTPHKARAVRVKFFAGNLDSRVVQVRVTDGGVSVNDRIFNGNWSGNQNLIINFPAPYTFVRGPGISVKMRSGPDALTDKYIFYAVGLDFID